MRTSLHPPLSRRSAAIGFVLFAGALCLSTAPARAADVDAELLFVRRIAPLFSEKCLACHGNDEKKIKGGYDMRTREGTLRGGDSEQAAVVPGKPGHSPLLLAISRDHLEWEPMPPKEADALNEQQRIWVREWIAGGAPWPDETRAKEIARANAERWSAEDGVAVATSGGLSPGWTARRYKPDGLWAYQPVRKPAIPGSGDTARNHPIDVLLAARAPAGVQPAPAADARNYIRRATFDLTDAGGSRGICGNIRARPRRGDA
jgi:mono/diheme cytochrome c family protein